MAPEIRHKAERARDDVVGLGRVLVSGKENLLVSTSGFIRVFYLALVQGLNCHLVVPICWFSNHDHSSPGVSFILNSPARETGATRLLSLL